MARCVPTQAALAYQSGMRARFPLMVPWGICGHCTISRTNTFSQHAYGNACDLHPPTKAYGDAAYRYALANRERFGIVTLCWYGQGGCTTGHRDHIHADFVPHRTGDPPAPCGHGAPDGTTPLPRERPEPNLNTLAAALLYAVDPHNWVRVGETVAGAALMVIGIYLLLRESDILPTY